MASNGTSSTAMNKADNEVCVKGASELSEALKVNTALTELNLECEATRRSRQSRHKNINNENRLAVRLDGMTLVSKSGR